MQNIVLEIPYQFVPPTRGRIWPAILPMVLRPYLRRSYGVTGYTVRDAAKLQASIAAGHGVVLPGNHPRPCDPMACGWLTQAIHHPFFCMASWHTFMGSKMERFFIRRCGAYSIYREGIDHASLNFSIAALTTAERPVVIFAEGMVTRNNDRIAPLMEGMSFVARMAARRRAKTTPPGKVLIHPFVHKYFFQGDLEATLSPVVSRMEAQLGLSAAGRTLLDRVRYLEHALLALREQQYFGAPRPSPEGSPAAGDRAEQLLEKILVPLETQWSQNDSRPEGCYSRIQQLRGKILPDIVAGKVDKEELQRRRQQLADLYIAQSLTCHPRNCLAGDPTPEEIIEAVERIEEDLTDVATPHGPMHLVIQVGDAIEVTPQRSRDAVGDPLVDVVRQNMTQMLNSIPRPAAT